MWEDHLVVLKIDNYTNSPISGEVTRTREKNGSVVTFISFLSKWDLQDPLGSPRNSASSLLFLCIFFILCSGFHQKRAALPSYKLILTYSELCSPAFSHESKSDTLYKRTGIKRIQTVKARLPWQPSGTPTDLLWPPLSLPTIQKPISHESHCDI